MAGGDIQTLATRGLWRNRVVGEGELAGRFTSRREAVEEGRRLAKSLGTHHSVVGDEPPESIEDEVARFLA
jgi:hypothetical protein